jgi:hypothetical protein
VGAGFGDGGVPFVGEGVVPLGAGAGLGDGEAPFVGEGVPPVGAAPFVLVCAKAEVTAPPTAVPMVAARAVLKTRRFIISFSPRLSKYCAVILNCNSPLICGNQVAVLVENATVTI